MGWEPLYYNIWTTLDVSFTTRLFLFLLYIFLNALWFCHIWATSQSQKPRKHRWLCLWLIIQIYILNTRHDENETVHFSLPVLRLSTSHGAVTSVAFTDFSSSSRSYVSLSSFIWFVNSWTEDWEHFAGLERVSVAFSHESETKCEFFFSLLFSFSLYHHTLKSIITNPPPTLPPPLLPTTSSYKRYWTNMGRPTTVNLI